MSIAHISSRGGFVTGANLLAAYEGPDVYTL